MKGILNKEVVKMKDVILFCGAGISSSTIIAHLRTIAHNRGIEITMNWATSGVLLSDMAHQHIQIKNTGLILVAPHIAEAAASIKSQVPAHIPVCILENKYLGDYEALFDFCLLKLSEIN